MRKILPFEKVINLMLYSYGGNKQIVKATNSKLQSIKEIEKLRQSANYEFLKRQNEVSTEVQKLKESKSV